tara:strand:+ start:116 stop:313 length:198 start_codon:yes stop_codon:yes gene_type:complete
MIIFTTIERIRIYNGFMKVFPTSCLNIYFKILNYLLKKKEIEQAIQQDKKSVASGIEALLKYAFP